MTDVLTVLKTRRDFVAAAYPSVPQRMAGITRLPQRRATAMAAALSGANLVYESAGMYASLLGACPESILMDNDVLGGVCGLSVDDIREGAVSFPKSSPRAAPGGSPARPRRPAAGVRQRRDGRRSGRASRRRRERPRSSTRPRASGSWASGPTSAKGASSPPKATRTMSGPVGRSGALAERAAPIQAESAPKVPEISTSRAPIMRVANSLDTG